MSRPRLGRRHRRRGASVAQTRSVMSDRRGCSRALLGGRPPLVEVAGTFGVQQSEFAQLPIGPGLQAGSVPTELLNLRGHLRVAKTETGTVVLGSKRASSTAICVRIHSRSSSFTRPPVVVAASERPELYPNDRRRSRRHHARRRPTTTSFVSPPTRVPSRTRAPRGRCCCRGCRRPWDSRSRRASAAAVLGVRLWWRPSQPVQL